MILPYALPPAESRISFKAIARSFIERNPEFQEKLSAMLRVRSCVLANSARTLLYLVLSRLAHESGYKKSTVLIPGYTCYTVAAAVVKAGLKVALYDQDPHSLRYDPEDVSRKMSSDTLAVVGQHLLGVVDDMNWLADIAHKYQASLIEDSAQSMSSAILNKDNTADYTVYSFGRGKPLPLGQGGALVSYSGKELDLFSNGLKKIMKNSRFCLKPMVVQLFSRPGLYWFLERLPLGLGQTVYDPGYEVSGISPYYASLGQCSVADLDRLNSHRIRIAKVYSEAFGSKASRKQLIFPFVRFPMKTEKGSMSTELFNLGVRRLYPRALVDLEPLRPELTDPETATPGSVEIAAGLITLPTHLGIDDQTARRIAGKVLESFDRVEGVCQ